MARNRGSLNLVIVNPHKPPCLSRLPPARARRMRQRGFSIGQMSRKFLALIPAWPARAVISKLIAVFLVILPQPLNSAAHVSKEDLKQLRSRIETLQKELAETEESKSE